jgi:hypothetical protein
MNWKGSICWNWIDWNHVSDINRSVRRVGAFFSVYHVLHQYLNQGRNCHELKKKRLLKLNWLKSWFRHQSKFWMRDSFFSVMHWPHQHLIHVPHCRELKRKHLLPLNWLKSWFRHQSKFWMRSVFFSVIHSPHQHLIHELKISES